jgi:hypothetical protein
MQKLQLAISSDARPLWPPRRCFDAKIALCILTRPFEAATVTLTNSSQRGQLCDAHSWFDRSLNSGESPKRRCAIADRIRRRAEAPR